MQFAVPDKKTVPTNASTHRHQHAFRISIQILDAGNNRKGPVFYVGRGTFENSNRTGIKSVVGSILYAGQSLGTKHSIGTSDVDWQDIVFCRLDPEQVLKLPQFGWKPGCEVMCLRKVLVQVVQLPLGSFQIELTLFGHPGQNLERTGPPAVVINRAISQYLEILLGMAIRYRRIVEGIDHRRAINRPLRCAVHARRHFQTGGFKDRRRDIDRVVKLAAQTSLVLDPLGPCNHQGVAHASEVGSDALDPLKRCIHCPTPTCREIVVVLWPSDFVYFLEHRLNRLRHIVEERHAVHVTLQSSLATCTVIPNRVNNQRVVILA